MFVTMRFTLAMLAVGYLSLGAAPAHSQSYPNKSIRILTSETGGGSDLLSRILAQRMAGPLGQPVIVENHGGDLAGRIVAQAPPDGYALLVVGVSIWIEPLVQAAPYDTAKDFAPVTAATTAPNILVVTAGLPAKSVKELIALAKSKPGALNFASSGVGSSAHLLGELFNLMAEVNMVHVPYKGSGPASTDLIAGNVQLAFSAPGVVTPHIKSEKLRALAITSAEPTKLFPGIPTVTASGLPGFESEAVTGVLMPVKTPAAIVARLNKEIVAALTQPDVKERLFNTGVDVVASTPEQYAAKMKAYASKMARVIKEAGIKGG